MAAATRTSSGHFRRATLSGAAVCVATNTRCAHAGSSSGGSGGGDADGAFWTEQLKSLLRNAVDLAVLSGVPLSLSVLDHVVRSAPRTADELDDEGWQSSSACLAMLRAAEQRATSEADRKTLAAVAAFWLDKFPSQPDRTQASIVTMFDGLLDGFLRGPLAEAIVTRVGEPWRATGANWIRCRFRQER